MVKCRLQQSYTQRQSPFGSPSLRSAPPPSVRLPLPPFGSPSFSLSLWLPLPQTNDAPCFRTPALALRMHSLIILCCFSPSFLLFSPPPLSPPSLRSSLHHLSEGTSKGESIMTMSVDIAGSIAPYNRHDCKNTPEELIVIMSANWC